MAEKSKLCVTPSQPNTKSVQKDSPSMILYGKMENLVSKMQVEGERGVPIKTVKSLLTKIPDVFTGEDLVSWLMSNLEIEDQDEAIHLGSLIAAHGYFFPIDDHVITLKNDSSFYRFQLSFYWPSNGWDPENEEYAVYLCKRTMQNKARLELADYEAENLARLQRTFSRIWETIFARAEQEAKKDRKREKIERKVFDSRERAFWDVHRPVPGCVNTLEVDIKKSYWYTDKSKRSVYNSSPRKTNENSLKGKNLESKSVEMLTQSVKALKQQLDRHCLKMSKVSESLMNYTQKQASYDPLMTAVKPSNPWVSNEDHYWTESRAQDITPQRAARWKLSFIELLRDEQGRSEFRKFLEKEVSAENLDFYVACRDFKMQPVRKVKDTVNKIFNNFLSDEAPIPINIDSQVKEATIKNMENPDRYCFEQAQEHIFHLMRSDSYARYLKSDQYKNVVTPKQRLFKNVAAKIISNPHNLLLADSSSEY